MTDKDNGLSQAKAQLASIVEMVEELKATDYGKDATQAIYEDALSVETRSDWHNPHNDPEITEYRILLCTGGPAVQIVGDLNEHREPVNASIEYQDWFTPWTRLTGTTTEEDEALMEYVRQFYFGE